MEAPNKVSGGQPMTMRPKRGVPEGLWIRCPQCKATIFRKEAESRFSVCPECAYHFYVPARERIRQLLDEDSFEEWFSDLRPQDVLGFKDRILYAERTGVPIARTIAAHAAQMRVKRRLKIRTEAARASLKILIPTVGCVFPTLWLILLGPALIVVLTLSSK